MTVYRDYDEKTGGLDHCSQQQCRATAAGCHDEYCTSSHRRCHASRLRFLLLPSLLALLGLCAFLFISCLYDIGDLSGGVGSDIVEGLARRAAGDSTNNSTFTNRKRM